MRLVVTAAVALLVLSRCSSCASAETEDNEFAEFEDEEVEEVEQPQPASHSTDKKAAKEEVQKQKTDDFDDDYGVVEDEEDTKEKEEFADVPAHFRSNWASYQVEALVLALIAMYLLNYVIGRNTNQSMALEWFDNVRGLLEQQFALLELDPVSWIICEIFGQRVDRRSLL
ncbi:hypothetical protein COOONC_23219 [Cooperia oncophora]